MKHRRMKESEAFHGNNVISGERIFAQAESISLCGVTVT